MVLVLLASIISVNIMGQVIIAALVINLLVNHSILLESLVEIPLYYNVSMILARKSLFLVKTVPPSNALEMLNVSKERVKA